VKRDGRSSRDRTRAGSQRGPRRVLRLPSKRYADVVQSRLLEVGYRAPRIDDVTIETNAPSEEIDLAKMWGDRYGQESRRDPKARPRAGLQGGSYLDRFAVEVSDGFGPSNFWRFPTRKEARDFAADMIVSGYRQVILWDNARRNPTWRQSREMEVLIHQGWSPRSAAREVRWSGRPFAYFEPTEAELRAARARIRPKRLSRRT